MDRERASTRVGQLGPPWLTVEFGLYLLLVLIAAFLRFWALGSQPLQEKEAQLALDAWRFLTGNGGSIRGHSPLLFQGDVLLFLLFGASDYVARVLPTLVGSLMVGLPYLLRSHLGRRGALISAVLLTFFPTFVLFSRHLNGDIIASACGLVLLVGIFGYLERGKASNLYLIAGALAVSLVAGGASYAMLLAFGGFFLSLFLYSRYGGKEEFILPGTGLRSAPTRQTLLKAGGIFVALILLLSTGLLVNLQGLQATLDLLPAWLSHFAPLVGGQPWHYYPSSLLAYELPVFVFGLAGIFYLARRDLFCALLACWFGTSLILYSLMGTKPPSGLMQMLLPLTLLAGKTIGELLSKVGEGQRWVWDRLVLLISIPVIFQMMLQLGAFTNPENPGDPRHLILVLLSVFFLTSLIVITGVLSLDWRSTLRTAGLVLLLITGALMVHTTWRLNYHQPGNPLELLVENPTSKDVRNLVRTIEETSNQRERQRHSIDITATLEESPLLDWYLRDFPDLTFSPGSLPLLSPVVITPLDEPAALSAYRGARFRLQSSWRAESMPAHALLGWYLYREALSPPMHYDIMMWVAP